MSEEVVEKPNKNDLHSELIKKLTSLLNNENTDDALILINDEQFSASLVDCSWDLIPIASGYLNSYNIKNKPDLFQCCVTLLENIASRCDPAETLLEFIEQAECLDNDTKFCTILRPIATCLKRLEGSRGRSLEWCINTIKSHVSELPVPENQKLEGDEIVLLDTDPAVFRIVNVYQAILPFLKLFISEVSLSHGEIVIANQRELLLSSMISLLGKPFCYLEFEDKKSLRRMLADDILKCITHLTGNPFRFFEYVEKRIMQVSNPKSFKEDYIEKDYSSTKEANHLTDLFTPTDMISDLAYANFYYLILGSDLQLPWVPCVYHPHYVLQNCLYLSSCLLKNPEYLLILKGLALIKAALVRIDPFSVDTDALELKIYSKFIEDLSQVMIYCDVREQRESSFEVFKLYFRIFTMEAKYLLIIHLYDVFNHSGLRSCLTSIVKDSVIKCLESDPIDPSFTGKRIYALLVKACKMPFLSSSDLVEISDEIIGSLNFIRFLVIRDKTNLTGVWNFTAKLETDFIHPLREGLNMSRAHYQLKIKDLEAQDKFNKSQTQNEASKSNDKISITVGGKTLPTMPTREKINFCLQAMNAFDVMESILIRVNECIEQRLLK
ncbi:glomulin [Athalia rosae]|uniref:glomulin n=1 Tax=Athalia rosae TaxID=37344 RepID=UPI0020346EC6|nr:glomulin [Athalia rosae]